MSRFNRISSNVLSGARRLTLAVIPGSVHRKVSDFGNWLIDYVGPEQTSQVFNEIVEHVRANYHPTQSVEIEATDFAKKEFTRVYTINGIEGYDV